MSNPLPIIPGRLPAAPDKYDRDNEAMTRRIIELALARGPTATGSTLELAEGEGTLLEVIDRLNGGGAGAGVSLIPSGSLRSSTTTQIFYTNPAGTGHPFTVHSGITASVRKSTATNGAQCTTPEWPIFTDWEEYNLPLELFTPLRYVFSCVVFRHDATCEIGIKNDPGLLSDDDTRMGYALFDDSGVWGIHRRLTSGGSLEVLETLVDLSSTEARRLIITYDEGPLPILTFSLDSEIVYQTSGVANMPEQPSSTLVTYGPAATGNIITTDNRIIVQEISSE